MLPDEFIAEVKARTDLHSLVSRFVGLKKSGANWIGKCPFHEDDSPSFTVPASKPFYHCFGCGAHGSAIDFVMHQTGATFPDAVEQLARDAGLPLPDKKKAKGKALYRPLKAEARYTPLPGPKEGHEPLSDDELQVLEAWQSALPGSPAERYLASRRIPLDLAQSVGAGYLPPRQAMGTNAEGKPTGFGPRIIFPHQLPDGSTVNLYGRATQADADKAQKHRHLSRPKGLLNVAALALPGPLWIVEGAFDCLALMAAGVQKVVAVFGLDGFDWRWIGRGEIVIAIDHDAAGVTAAEKLTIEAAYRGIKARRLPAECFGGEKDASAAWAAGVLDLSSYGITVSVKRETVEAVEQETQEETTGLPVVVCHDRRSSETAGTPGGVVVSDDRTECPRANRGHCVEADTGRFARPVTDDDECGSVEAPHFDDGERPDLVANETGIPLSARGIFHADDSPEGQAGEGSRDVPEDSRDCPEVVPGDTPSPADLRGLLLRMPDAAPRYLAEHWGRFKAVALAFTSRHLADALAMGWTLPELFSVPTGPLPTDAGVLWSASCFDHTGLVLHPDRLVVELGQAQYLQDERKWLRPSGLMPWAVRLDG